MVRIRTEKEYVIKVIDYKGNLLSSFKLPKTKGDLYKAMVQLARLYERAKKYSFLTKDLFKAIKAYAQVLYNTESALHLAIKNPALLKHFKEILNTPIEEFEEEIVYGKVREKESTVCSICKVSLVYPAYIVFKKKGKEIKRSAPIGIKCLNKMTEKIFEYAQKVAESFSSKKRERFEVKERRTEKIENLVGRVEVSWERLEEDIRSLRQRTILGAS